MSSNHADSVLVQALAERLADDLRVRGLRQGDPYLTASEAGQLLNVSTATAHRALKLLSSHGVLTRCRGRGTFVGPAAPVEESPVIRTVCVLLPADLKEIHELRLDVLVRTLREQLVDTSVQFGFVPPEGGARFLRDLLVDSHTAAKIIGAIAISCGRETYRALSELQLPVVMWGTLYPRNAPLPSVDGDHRSAGHLLTTYLIKRGHCRMALLNPRVPRPGQSLFLDGGREALAQAGLPGDAMIIRTVSDDAASFKATVGDMFALANPPTALITRGEKHAAWADQAAEVHQSAAIQPVEVVFREPSTRVERSPFAHTHPTLDFAEVAVRITQILKRLREGENLEYKRLIIPMELCPGERTGI